jgi:hypothetical protein
VEVANLNCNSNERRLSFSTTPHSIRGA